MLRRREERGFTLVELAVAMSIMLLVAGALLGALESGTNAEHRASTRVDDEQSARLVLAQFSRDIRNATTLRAIVRPASPTPNQLDLTVNGQHITWWYDTTGHVLRRKVPCAVGGTCSGVSVGNLTNAPGTVFTLVASDGSNLFTVPGDGVADEARCAATVLVSVTSAAHPPSKPFTETASAPFHSTLADQRGCP